jgi:hypothetical protein
VEPTDEQVNARDLFATGDSLAIEAGAGTGKTSTLELLAASTYARGQYVAFNKAIVDEAGGRMPPSVRANTAHSLAMRAVGHRYRHRLNSERMKPWDLAALLGIDKLQVRAYDGETKMLQPSFLGGLTMAAITRFCQSADEEPTYRHCPYVEGLDSTVDGKRSYTVNNIVGKWIEPAMRKAWADLQNEHGKLPYKHDHYLKQWQLEGPVIASDFILFDEAQDANPVMVAIVAAQDQAQLVWVGDSQQQIYSFTGAVNALDQVPADQRAFLTQSFRFGPEIATVANQVLNKLQASLRLRGTPGIPSRLDRAPAPDVILSRTNAAAVREVLDRPGQKVHLVGGGGEIVRFARAAQALQDGRRTEHPELACFDSWNEVKQYVYTDHQGSELRLMVNLIDTFTVERIIAALDRNPPEKSADLIVSTAHKAKGREWGTVKLASDFPDDPKGEELRLLYVSVTRAKHVLDLSDVKFFNPDGRQPEPHAVGVRAFL